MSTQASLTLVPKNQETPLDVLRCLTLHLAECEDMVLSLPLRQYEVINQAVPNMNVRSQVSKMRERFEDGITTLQQSEVA
jgi:hypothetical protein